MLPLTKEELKLHQDAKVCYIYGKIILKKLSKTINYQKVRDHFHFTGKYRGASYSICNIKFNEVPVFPHNDSNNYYHLTIKELAKEFAGQLECLGENTGKYKKQVIKIDKDGNERIVTISYKIKLIDSARFMETLLSNLVDNLTEGIHKI